MPSLVHFPLRIEGQGMEANYWPTMHASLAVLLGLASCCFTDPLFQNNCRSGGFLGGVA